MSKKIFYLIGIISSICILINGVYCLEDRKSSSDPIDLKSPQKPMKVLGSPQKPMKVLGSPQKPMKVLGSPQKPMKVLGSPQKQDKDPKQKPGNGPDLNEVKAETIPPQYEAPENETTKLINLKNVEGNNSRIDQNLSNNLSENSMPELNASIDNGTYEADAARTFTKIFPNPTDYYKNPKYNLSADSKDILRIMGVGFLNETLDPKTRLIDPQCGKRAAFTERLLEQYGIHAVIVTADQFRDYKSGHAWVKVTNNQKEEIYIDPTCGSSYLRTEEAYKPIDEKGNYKKGYNEFKDIYAIQEYYKHNDKKFSNFDWWDCPWGSAHINAS